MKSAADRTAGAILTIDLQAICDNWRFLVATAGADVLCAAVLKADAYGLGADRVGPTLFKAGCRQFFVAHVDEGISLRKALSGDVADIAVLHGPPPDAESVFVDHSLTPVLNSLEQVDAWAGLGLRRGVGMPAFLQVDTGMSRMGLSQQELRVLSDDPTRLDGIKLRYVMSHLACADDGGHPANASQLASFLAALQVFPKARASLCNSSGIFLGADYHFDMVRPGAALYGVSPWTAAANPMKAVVRLEARVIQLREVPEQGFVGYGSSWTARRTTRVATLSVGYADGLLRSLGNHGAAYLGAARLPIIGRVSMDSITVDVSDLPAGDIQAGSWVELLGEHQGVDDLAQAAGTIGYEILTGLGHRFARRYLEPQADRSR